MITERENTMESKLLFEFINENECIVTEQAINGQGTVKRYKVPSKEVFDGILKFSIENKKIEPISVPPLNYFQSPAKPTLLTYDYFPQNMAALAAIYIPPYDCVYKYHSGLSYVYPDGKDSKENREGCLDSISTLFKALASEGLIQCHVAQEKSRYGDTPIISVPWKQPGQLFLVLYNLNMASSEPFNASRYLGHVCWYVDGDLSNGYANVNLYPAYLANHYSVELRSSGTKCNRICLGKDPSHDIRNIFQPYAEIPFTINNHDLFEDTAALSMLVWCSKDSLFKQELLKYTFDHSDKASKADSFKLMGTGEAFNEYYLKAISSGIGSRIDVLGDKINAGIKSIKDRLDAAAKKASHKSAFEQYQHYITESLDRIASVSYSGIGRKLNGEYSYKMGKVLSDVRSRIGSAKKISAESLYA